MKHHLPLIEVISSSSSDQLELVLQGEVDMSNVADLKSLISGLLDNRLHEVIVDVDGLSYMDSAGIAFMFELERLLKAHQQVLKIRLCNSRYLLQLFQVVGLDDLVIHTS